MPDFSPDGRAAALAQAAAGVDLVVIGGGITGAGVALEAASRGLQVALVERHDFASGTSSRSSKLVHGGLRYLQQREFALVYEGLLERQRLLRAAPHLVRPLPFLIPLFGSNRVVARGINWALTLYDITGGFRIGKLHRRIDLDATRRLMPTLRTDRLTAGFLYYDAQTDDARLTLSILRTAALRYGALIANHCSAVRIEKDARGDVAAVVARDELTGEEVRIPCALVANAAGLWVDDVRALDESTHPDTIRPAKGVHVLVPRELVGNDVAVVLPVPKDRRSIFVIPWGDLTLVGTTDTDYEGDTLHPEATPGDIGYLLGALNTWIEGEVTTADVVASYAGLRPLVKSGGDSRTADLSRRHSVAASPSGVVTVAGGKLTTWRRMASDTVDACGRFLPRRLGRSVSVGLPLDGAAGWRDAESAVLAAELAGDTAAHLARRHGGHAAVIAALAASQPGLNDTLVPGLPYIRAEVVWAVRHEMALSVEDVLARRTRISFETRDRGVGTAAAVAALMAAELGRDRAWEELEVAAYGRSVDGRMESEQQRELGQTA